MHLVGFTIEIYYDARSYKRQIWHHITHDIPFSSKCFTGIGIVQSVQRPDKVQGDRRTKFDTVHPVVYTMNATGGFQAFAAV